MTEPTCLIMGHVVGHPDNCGDCDPCIGGQVSEPVRRLLAEICHWRDQYELAVTQHEIAPSDDDMDIKIGGSN